MTEEKETQEKSSKSSAVSTSMPLMDIFFMTLRHWPWIIASVAICVGLAYLYVLRTPNVYTRSAEIQIKQDSKGKSTGSEGEFAQLGLFKPNTNIQDEIANLTSKDLMEEVVSRLGLDISYYGRGKFHDVDLYNYNLPVKLTVADYPASGKFSLDLTVDKNGKVSISELSAGESKPYTATYSGKLNDSIATPIGKIVVSPSSFYKPGKKVSIAVKKVPILAAMSRYRGAVSASQSGASRSNVRGSIVRMTSSDTSPERADDVLNMMITVYNEKWIHDRNQISESTSNFINERLTVIEKELGSVDSDISAYKSENLVPDVKAAASMYMSQNQAAQTQILALNNQLAVAKYILTYLSADLNSEQLLPVNTGLEGSNVQGLITDYNANILQRKSLVAKSSEKNPLVAQLDQQLKDQRGAIISSINNEIVAINTQLKSLKATEAKTVSQIASNPTQAKNLLSTERQQKVKESLYLYLLQKREENELSQAFTAYNTRVVNRPGASGVPVTPDKRKILGFAFIIGLVIPFGVTFLREMNNTKVRGRKDVEGLNVPFLGEIPYYGSPKKHKKKDDKKSDAKDKSDEKKIIVRHGSRNVINEAFRVLRTNVEFVSGSGENSIIAITSFNPGSGKSFISVNLGMSMALKNKKVLVIDGDMRHGSVSAYINSPSEGLANYLAGSVSDINSVIVQNPDCDNLYVLPVGKMPPNPTELLETPKFKTLIESLKSQYDYIIIDCPPIEVVADAQIIDRYADRSVFIVRAGLLERSMVPELDHLYNEKKFNNMAFILNGTSGAGGRYGYGRYGYGRYGYGYAYRYGYGYGYGYGYHYGSDKDE